MKNFRMYDLFTKQFIIASHVCALTVHFLQPIHVFNAVLFST